MKKLFLLFFISFISLMSISQNIETEHYAEYKNAGSETRNYIYLRPYFPSDFELFINMTSNEGADNEGGIIIRSKTELSVFIYVLKQARADYESISSHIKNDYMNFEDLENYSEQLETFCYARAYFKSVNIWSRQDKAELKFTFAFVDKKFLLVIHTDKLYDDRDQGVVHDGFYISISDIKVLDYLIEELSVKNVVSMAESP